MHSSFRGATVIASAMALVVVVAGSWLGYQQLSKPTCTGEVRLSVAAAPEIAPVIQTVANARVAEDPSIDGLCLAVDVTAADSVEIAAAVASRHQTTLTGVGEGSGTTAIPDLWVPDSSTWLLRVRQAAPGFAPTNGASVATSPVVIAMPEVVAKTVGWPKKKLTWTELLQNITAGSQLKTGIVDPAKDASGLSGLLALGAAAGAAGPNAQETTAAALRALALGRSSLRAELLARFPRATDATSLADSVSLASLSEEDVIAYNATKPPVALAALYLDPAALPLDYPFAVMPEVDSAHSAAADALYSALSSGRYRDALAGRGLRGPDGSFGTGFAAPTGAPGPPAAPSDNASASSSGSAAAGLDASAIGRALASWTAITSPGRMLAVFDISGSMLEEVPTAGGKTRAQVTVEAAGRGLALFDDKWSLGVWVFSTELVGSRDWRELVPIGPLTAQRSRLQNSLGLITPKRTGDTGLYDTVLAAYKQVQSGWQPGLVNSVVLFTDGQNDDDNTISRATLLKNLQEAADPDRPVRLIIIGIGNGVNKGELDSITKVIGGSAFVAQDPAKIDEIFLQAIASRASTTD